MGADVFVMQQVGAKFTKTILVEKEEIKRIICDNLNPPELMSDGGVDYAWHTDVHDITRDDIQKLGTGSIGRLDISAPCKERGRRQGTDKGTDQGRGAEWRGAAGG